MPDLKALLSPRSVAVVGASRDLGRINGRPLRFLLEKGYAGRIYPINPKYREIAGLPCYPDLDAVPGPIDMAIVAVPARAVPETIEALVRRRVPAAVVFSSGFGETGEEGRAIERQIRDVATAGGLRLCGPNCLGLVNAFDRLAATFSQFADGDTPEGPVGFVTQSGAFGTAIAALARARGLGLGYFVNTGNECDVGFAEVMQAVLADPRIRVGAGYLEGLKDGPGLIEVAREALACGKPLVLTKVGRTASGARAAASHTGSLAGEDAVFAGVVRQYGLVRARNEEHMLDLVETFVHCALPAGPGVGIVTQSGGAAVLMADRAEELGLRISALAPETRERLRAVLPGFGVAANPVDITGQFVAEPELLGESLEILLADAAIDIGVVWIQLMDAHVDTLVDILERAKARVAKPFIVCWVAASERALSALRDRGIAVLRGAEPAIDAVAGLWHYARARRDWQAEITERTAPAARPALPPQAGIVGAIEAAGLLEAAGVALLRPLFAANPAEAGAAAARLGGRVALKIDSPDLPHKTDVGGVRLGLAAPGEVETACASILAEVAERAPGARLTGFLVQPMAETGVELVIGLHRDPVMGLVVMAGLGGVLVEVLGDVAFRKAPVTQPEARRMLDELRGRALLDGVRGRPAVDLDAVAALIAAVSAFGAAAGERLIELDLNPVFAAGDRVQAADWLLVLA